MKFKESCNEEDPKKKSVKEALAELPIGGVFSLLEGTIRESLYMKTKADKCIFLGELHGDRQHEAFIGNYYELKTMVNVPKIKVYANATLVVGKGEYYPV